MGAGVLEVSHRSKPFMAAVKEAEVDLRALMYVITSNDTCQICQPNSIYCVSICYGCTRICVSTDFVSSYSFVANPTCILILA